MILTKMTSLKSINTIHIITRGGIEKIQAIENIGITYQGVIKCEPHFAVFKAKAKKQ